MKISEETLTLATLAAVLALAACTSGDDAVASPEIDEESVSTVPTSSVATETGWTIYSNPDYPSVTVVDAKSNPMADGCWLLWHRTWRTEPMSEAEARSIVLERCSDRRTSD